MSLYNKHYQKQNYFGEPYPELLEYFNKLDRELTVLDLGCGQGRDVLGIGKMGFSVVGIDLSEVGINQLNQYAKNENLNVKGIVCDLDRFDQVSEFDIVLLDSMFHFYKNDIDIETARLHRILNSIKPNGIVIIVLQENKFRINYLKSIILSDLYHFVIDVEEHLIYKEVNSKFYMISVQKINY